MEEDLVICGVGGVGSHVAYLLTKLPKEHPFNPRKAKIALIDHDIVEEKNIERQAYLTAQIGEPKAEAMKSILVDILGGDLPNVTFLQRKLESPLDLKGINTNALAIIATDNLDSKRMLAKVFKKKLIINCGKDRFEVKTEMDKSDEKAWSLNSGYNSDQTFLSNIRACAEVYKQLRDLSYRTVIEEIK